MDTALQASVGRAVDEVLALDDPAEAVLRYHLAGGGVDSLLPVDAGDVDVLPVAVADRDGLRVVAAGSVVDADVVVARIIVVAREPTSRATAERGLGAGAGVDPTPTSSAWLVAQRGQIP